MTAAEWKLSKRGRRRSVSLEHDGPGEVGPHPGIVEEYKEGDGNVETATISTKPQHLTTLDYCSLAHTSPNRKSSHHGPYHSEASAVYTDAGARYLRYPRKHQWLSNSKS